MSPAEYGIRRQAIADQTGIPFKYLDAEYDGRRRSVKDERRKTIERAYWHVLNFGLSQSMGRRSLSRLKAGSSAMSS
jgi:hypothetical protein